MNGSKKCPSQTRRFVGRPTWRVDMKREIGVVPESFAHLFADMVAPMLQSLASVHCLIFPRFLDDLRS